MPLAGIQIDGIWHTSIVLRSREIYYGQGIQEVSPPGTTHHGRPVKVVDLGETELDEETFEEYLNELRDHYRADKVGFSLSLAFCVLLDRADKSRNIENLRQYHLLGELFAFPSQKAQPLIPTLISSSAQTSTYVLSTSILHSRRDADLLCLGFSATLSRPTWQLS